MKYKLSILIICVLMSGSILGYELVINNNGCRRVPTDVVELGNETAIVMTYNTCAENKYTSIYFISKLGAIVNSVEIEGIGMFFFAKSDSSAFILAKNLKSNKLITFKAESNNVVPVDTLESTYFFSSTHLDAKPLNNCFCFGGLTAHSMTDGQYIYLGKISNVGKFDGELIYHKTIATVSFDIACNQAGDVYLYSSQNQIFVFDNNLMVKDTLSIAGYGPDFYFDALWLNNDTMVVGGQHENSDSRTTDLCIALVDSNLDLLTEHQDIDDKYRNYAGIYSCLSEIENGFYLAGTMNYQLRSSWSSDTINKTKLIKYNSEGIPIWEKYYGGEYYYITTTITSTKNSGCIIAATQYKKSYGALITDAYIIKLSSEGNVEPISAINVIEGKGVKIYPNPGFNELIIESEVNCKERILKMFTIDGKIVLEEDLFFSKELVNVNRLNSGFYIYCIIEEGKVIKAGRWMKK